MNPKVRVLVAFMESNLHRELTLDDLQEVVGLSHSRLHSLFKAELGFAPIQYHRILRLEEARVLLEHTFWKVERIRMEVGYSDHSHFLRYFKAQFGVTPSQYRARYIDATVSTKSAKKKIGQSATEK